MERPFLPGDPFYVLDVPGMAQMGLAKYDIPFSDVVLANGEITGAIGTNLVPVPPWTTLFLLGWARFCLFCCRVFVNIRSEAFWLLLDRRFCVTTLVILLRCGGVSALAKGDVTDTVGTNFVLANILFETYWFI